MLSVADLSNALSMFSALPLLQAAVFLSFTTNSGEQQWSHSQPNTQPNTAIWVSTNSFELSQLKVKELKSVSYKLGTIMFATSAHAHSLLLYFQMY